MPKKPEKSVSAKPYKKITLFFYALIIAVATFALFQPAINFDFTNWDDNEYVTGNPDIKGFSAYTISKAFTSFYVGNYQPLTLLSYMADYSLSGFNPAGYHCTNVILHSFNAILVFLLCFVFFKNPLGSFFAALLFALHPLRIESVAWIAERKDVLSAFFYLISILTYMVYIQKNRISLLVVSGLMMSLSLLAKPMGVTIPLVMLLIDFFFKRSFNARIFIEKLPFFALSAAFSVITIIAQHSAGAIQDFPNLSILERVFVPFYVIAFYIVKTLIPAHLCAFYYQPIHPDMQMRLLILISPLLTIAVAIISYINRRNRPLLLGLLFFLTTLLPIIQIIPIGDAIVADRYTYIPGVGLALLAAAIISWILQKNIIKSMTNKTISLSIITTMIVAYSAVTFSYCTVWKNSETLWTDVISKYPNPTAFNNRAAFYNAQGDYENAISDFSNAIALKPTYAMAYNNRGAARLHLAQIHNDTSLLTKALADFNKALYVNHSLVQAWLNRANIFLNLSQDDSALANYDSAVSVSPHTAQVYYNRGMLLKEMQRFDKAISDFNTAIQCAPSQAVAYNERGVTLAYIGKYDEAIADFRQCILLDKSHPHALRNLNYIQSLKDSLSNRK